ncbi:MAG: helix-turn-helix transcriptional regulator [Endomicrobium sp.]|jgi:putative transcriptional regulator|nr:helix-turn-helix transcriptional regulator [Endomicrobium sp.]
MEKNVFVRNRIRMIRAEKSITQNELAKAVGVSRQTISAIENEVFNPSIKLVFLICSELDKCVEEVFYVE